MTREQNHEPGKQKRQSGPSAGNNSPGVGEQPVFRGLHLTRILMLTLFFFLLLNWLGTFNQDVRIPYSVFKEQLHNDNVAEVRLRGDRIRGTLDEEAKLDSRAEEPTTFIEFVTYFPQIGDERLMSMLEERQVTIEVQPEREFHWWYLLLFLSPFLLLGGLAYMQYRKMGGEAGGGLFNIGRSRARLHSFSKEQTTFDDVAGAESAKEELQEVVGFLQNPRRIIQLGGKLPKGLLMLGPPGCGKTLLARAVAGEAGVPFFSITGSDFMEMFVGVGASRVRDLFKDAKNAAPSIVFIDELDSVGRQRGAGLGGGHDEREQTLNQLLSEMDGFEEQESVIVMAATNRPDVLDPALRRPGRFDRQIMVPAPRQKNRLQILQIYAKKKKMAENLDLEALARSTPGFSGADLENLMNEAALLAGRKQKRQIDQEDLEQARDKVMMGLIRHGLVISDEEKSLIAYHEAGHAVVSVILADATPLNKVSIIPRTRAMGVTERVPEEEKYLYKREFILNQLAVMMGGRCAEELVFQTATTGAENDLKQATQMARRMVLEWGMSEDFMNIALGQERQQVFLGQELAQGRNYSESTAREVDQAVKKILSQASDKTTGILKQNRQAMDKLVERLLEAEEISGSEVEELVKAL